MLPLSFSLPPVHSPPPPPPQPLLPLAGSRRNFSLRAVRVSGNGFIFSSVYRKLYGPNRIRERRKNVWYFNNVPLYSNKRMIFIVLVLEKLLRARKIQPTEAGTGDKAREGVPE